MATRNRTHGGTRQGAGRPAEFTDGLPTRNVSVQLDPVTITMAKSIGNGKIAVGLRKAMRQACRARRVNDQMQCGFCGLSWDLDDKEPPACNLEHPLRVRQLLKKV